MSRACPQPPRPVVLAIDQSPAPLPRGSVMYRPVWPTAPVIRERASLTRLSIGQKVSTHGRSSTSKDQALRGWRKTSR
jgi:hypothetical protein